jgi:hypothetical protein
MLQRRKMLRCIAHTYGRTVELVKGMPIHLDTGTEW